MARPKSEDKRNAILWAAASVIVSQGLSAPTALIAKEAGVSNGSLFTYFATKVDLYNQLYLALKDDMAGTAMAGLPQGGLPEQAYGMWSNWLRWAIDNPEKRGALAQLAVSEELTPATREAGHRSMAGIVGLLERSRAKGPLRDAPMPFVAGIMASLAEATINYAVQDPDHAEAHCKTGFEALWRVIA